MSCSSKFSRVWRVLWVIRDICNYLCVDRDLGPSSFTTECIPSQSECFRECEGSTVSVLGEENRLCVVVFFHPACLVPPLISLILHFLTLSLHPPFYLTFSPSLPHSPSLPLHSPLTSLPPTLPPLFSLQIISIQHVSHQEEPPPSRGLLQPR